MRPDTRTLLLDGALAALERDGIAKASARAIAAEAGVNQALVFYHFGSVDALLAEACRHGAERTVARYRSRLAHASSLAELVRLGREVHDGERGSGGAAVLAQLLAGARTRPWLAAATAAGLDAWTAELDAALTRVVSGTAVDGLLDTRGLARALAAGFIGLELYEGVDAEGAEHALNALERMGDMAAVLEDLGPVARSAVRARLRKAAQSDA